MPENKTFDVTVVRIGHATVEAASAADAMTRVDELPTSEIEWFGAHDATDAREVETE